MPWQSKTREDIEDALHRRLRTCSETRDQLLAELRLLDAATRDAAGISDGAFAARKSRTINEARRAANSRYQAVLEDFTAFVVDGKLPPEE